ncbi:hypothetical protein PQQ51_23430 [Paraburkholderia xenovorans]|uniref:hypothetical protein n=1 Tax=Paraburkholderia xenovorans TaxID=36873 RepID=UPI0038BDBCF6
MKTVTVDMLRAHLMAASVTAMGAEVVVCIALLISRVSQQTLSSPSFRLFALAVIVVGVIVIRRVAQAAFELAIAGRRVVPCLSPLRPAQVLTDCPRKRLVILHLRLTGTPFVLAEE